jgi:hypothetical protein
MRRSGFLTCCMESVRARPTSTASASLFHLERDREGRGFGNWIGLTQTRAVG